MFPTSLWNYVEDLWNYGIDEACSITRQTLPITNAQMHECSAHSDRPLRASSVVIAATRALVALFREHPPRPQQKSRAPKNGYLYLHHHGVFLTQGPRTPSSPLAASFLFLKPPTNMATNITFHQGTTESVVLEQTWAVLIDVCRLCRRP